MISRTRNVLALLALAALPMATFMQPTSAVAKVDCSDGYPRLGCPIWKVTVKASIPPAITCETGSEWKCARDLF